MECRQFDITLISANDLESVRRFHKMKVYAIVSIGHGGPEEHGETNPAWDFTTRFTVGELVVKNSNTKLVVKLFCMRTMGDRYIGEVRRPMKELFDANGGNTVMSLPVQKGCKNSQGGLTFSYRFGEKVMGRPMEKGSEKGPGKGFPWRKTIEVLIEGVFYILVVMDVFNVDCPGDDYDLKMMITMMKKKNGDLFYMTSFDSWRINFFA